MICRFLLVALLASAEVHAQDAQSVAQQVYKASAESVFLIETRDASNQADGQATAFSVGPSLLLTNAHAVAGASVWVKIGPATLPAKVERIDHVNDLALLRVGGEISAPSLTLASSAPDAGVRVYAIGNPRGLERTVTEGLSGGVRNVEGRTLLQISAAISPGSSGGPVLDQAGKVVGVAVGVLRDAQNLNFAVPVSVVAAFLSNKSTVATIGTIERLRELLNERRDQEWSDEPASRYQRLTANIETTLRSSLNEIKSDTDLAELVAEFRYLENALALDVARRRASLTPKVPEVLYEAAEVARDVGIEAPLASEDTFYEEAEAFASRALSVSPLPQKRKFQLLLGEIQTLRKGREEIGIKVLIQAVSSSRDETAKNAALSLFRAYDGLERKGDAKKWFEHAESIGTVSPFNYGQYARVLEELGSEEAAARAHLKAATRLSRHYCEAARLFGVSQRLDEALANARTCLEGAAKVRNGDGQAEWAHRLLSSILAERGVYDQAISHARQAIAIDAESGYAFSALGTSLLKAERASEAEAALRSAIRLTDGAHDYMHFDLGMALFKQERWSESQRSFEQVAKMDPKNDVAAYNVAVCLARLRFFNDAAKWYEETLRRNPNRTDASEIRRRIVSLRQ